MEIRTVYKTAGSTRSQKFDNLLNVADAADVFNERQAAMRVIDTATGVDQCTKIGKLVTVSCITRDL